MSLEHQGADCNTGNSSAGPDIRLQVSSSPSNTHHQEPQPSSLCTVIHSTGDLANTSGKKGGGNKECEGLGNLL